MAVAETKFNWNSLRNLFFGIIFGIIILPLILLLFFASRYKVPIVKNTNSAKSNLASNITNTPVPETPTLPAKIVLINPTTNKPTYTAKSTENESNTAPSSTPTTTATTPSTTPPSTSPPPSLPSEIEFTGTVTGLAGNIVTFNYGSNKTVNITLRRTSASSITIGSIWHVHASLSNGVYVESELEKCPC